MIWEVRRVNWEVGLGIRKRDGELRSLMAELGSEKG